MQKNTTNNLLISGHRMYHERRTLVAYCAFLFLLLGNHVGERSGVSGATKRLRYVIGIHQTCHVGDKSVELQWLLSPAGGMIFFLRCYHRPFLDKGLKQQVLEYMSFASFTFKGHLQGRTRAKLTDDSLEVSIQTPFKKDDGWYMCEINTAESIDVNGALKLSVVIEYLTSVTSTSASFDEVNNATSLIWKYFSEGANVKNISCFYKSATDLNWRPLGIYTIQPAKFTTADIFLRRLEHAYEKGKFSLRFSGLHKNDQGEVICDFATDDNKTSSKSSLLYNSASESILSTVEQKFSTVQPVTHYTTLKLAAASLSKKSETCAWWSLAVVGVVCGFIGVVGSIIVQRICLCRKTYVKKNQTSIPESQPLTEKGKEDGSNAESKEDQARGPGYKQEKQNASFSGNTLETLSRSTNQPKAGLPKVQTGKHRSKWHSKGQKCNLPIRDTFEEMKRILNEVRLEYLTEIFQDQEITPSILSTLTDDDYRDKLDIENIGDIIHLRHYYDQKSNFKPNSEDTSIQDVLAKYGYEEDSEEVVKFKQENIHPNDVEYLKEEHWSELGIVTLGLQQKLKFGDVQMATHHEKLGKHQYKKSSSKGNTKNDYSSPKRLTSFGELGGHVVARKGDGFAQTKPPSGLNHPIFLLVTKISKDIFGRDKIVSSGEVGAVIFSRQDLKEPEVVCFATGASLQDEQMQDTIQSTSGMEQQTAMPRTNSKNAINGVPQPSTSTLTDIQNKNATDMQHEQINNKQLTNDTSMPTQDDSNIPPHGSTKTQPQKTASIHNKSGQQSDTDTGIRPQHANGRQEQNATQPHSPTKMDDFLTDKLLQECFSRFILEQIKARNEQYLVFFQDNRCCLKDEVQVNVYLSAPSCIPLCKEKGNDLSQGAQTAAVGYQKGKDCSEHLLLWQAAGLQGALLSHLMDPVHISSLYINNACHESCLQQRALLNLSEMAMQQLPEGYQNISKMKVFNIETDQKTPSGTPYFKYWYKGKNGGTTIYIETGKTVPVQQNTEGEESEISFTSRFKLFKATYNEADNKSADESKKGSLSYQQAKDVFNKYKA